MTFPTVPSGGQIVSANRASISATLTSPDLSTLTKSSGDLLIAIAVDYGCSQVNAWQTWGGGFTEFADFSASGSMPVGCAYKWSDGTETGTFTVTQAGSIGGQATMIIMAIPGSDGTTAPEAGGNVTGTSATADPGSLTPSWGAADTLWIAVAGCGETSTTGSFTGLAATNPTNYTGIVATSITADVVGGINAAVAFRQLNASSENPGAFSNDTSNTRVAALTIAVRPSSASPVSLTGAVADLALAAPAGTVSTVSPVALTGAVSPFALAAPAGAVSAGTAVSITGAVAPMALAAPAGTMATTSNVTLTGAVANTALAAAAGTVSVTSPITLTGAVANTALAAPAGTVATSSNVTLTGAVAGLTLAAPAGTFATTSNVTLTGAVANLALGAPAGTIDTSGAVSLTGAVANLDLAAPAGTVSAGSSIPVSLTGAAAALTLTAPAGSVSTVQSVTLSGPVAALDLAALAGTVATTGLISLTGETATLVLDAPAGVWSGALDPSDIAVVRALAHRIPVAERAHAAAVMATPSAVSVAEADHAATVAARPHRIEA